MHDVYGSLFRIDDAKAQPSPRTALNGVTDRALEQEVLHDRTDSAGQINPITVSRCALSRKGLPRRQTQKAGDYFWPQSIPIPVPLVGHPEKPGI